MKKKSYCISLCAKDMDKFIESCKEIGTPYSRLLDHMVRSVNHNKDAYSYVLAKKKEVLLKEITEYQKVLDLMKESIDELL